MRIIRARERGITRTSWLTSYHTYSFADYFNPASMRFGALRVVNDDTIAPGTGFGMHSHKDMEIVTIVTSGSLTHRDSTSGRATIHSGECQVMSAGTGITHSEKNADSQEPVTLFQIWIAPRTRGITPRYDQAKYVLECGKETVLASGTGETLHIEQDASISLLELDTRRTHDIALHPNQGCYLLIIDGEIQINDAHLASRDSAELQTSTTIRSVTTSRLLLIRVPLSTQM